MDCSLSISPHPRNFPGKSTGVGCHFLLQGIFLTRGSNLGLPYCSQMLYHLSHQGKIHTCIYSPFAGYGQDSLIHSKKRNVANSMRYHFWDCIAKKPSLHHGHSLLLSWLLAQREVGCLIVSCSLERPPLGNSLRKLLTNSHRRTEALSATTWEGLKLPGSSLGRI